MASPPSSPARAPLQSRGHRHAIHAPQPHSAAGPGAPAHSSTSPPGPHHAVTLTYDDDDFNLRTVDMATTLSPAGPTTANNNNTNNPAVETVTYSLKRPLHDPDEQMPRPPRSPKRVRSPLPPRPPQPLNNHIRQNIHISGQRTTPSGASVSKPSSIPANISPSGGVSAGRNFNLSALGGGIVPPSSNPSYAHAGSQDWRVAMHLDALHDKQLMRVIKDVEARCRALAAFESAEIRRAMALGLARA